MSEAINETKSFFSSIRIALAVSGVLALLAGIVLLVWPVKSAVIVTAIFAYGPMYGIQLAFREFDFNAGLTGGDWVGMKYFQQFFESPQFWSLMRNTVTISLTTLVFGFIAPIALALLINQVIGVRRKRVRS